MMFWKRNLSDADNVKFLRALSRVVGHIKRKLKEVDSRDIFPLTGCVIINFSYQHGAQPKHPPDGDFPTLIY